MYCTCLFPFLNLSVISIQEVHSRYKYDNQIFKKIHKEKHFFYFPILKSDGTYLKISIYKVKKKQPLFLHISLKKKKIDKQTVKNKRDRYSILPRSIGIP